MRTLAAALLIAMSTTAAASAPVFEHPVTPGQLAQIIAPAARELTKTPMLRGSFTQRKFLKDIPKPLKSTGSFVIARAQGIYWHTLLPFDSEFILTPTTMAQLDGGKLAMRLSAAQQPALRLVGDLFFSIFALDPGALAGNFALHGQSLGKAGWQLGLKPKSAALAGVLTEAVISGNARVEKVEMWDAHGDRTEITLIGGGSNAPLTAAEAELFRK